MSEFVVHGIAGSPFMRAVMAALEEKGVPYRAQSWAPGTHRSEAYLAMHPFGRVPVVEHDGTTIYETQAILRYIDQAFEGPPLQPADARAAARMNQLCGVNDWYFFPQVGVPMVFQRLIAPVLLGAEPDEGMIAAARPAAETCVRVLDGFLADNPFLAGEALTLADLLIYPQLAYFSQTPEGRELLTPRLKAWVERMSERPSSKATLPPEPLRKSV